MENCSMGKTSKNTEEKNMKRIFLVFVLICALLFPTCRNNNGNAESTESNTNLEVQTETITPIFSIDDFDVLQKLFCSITNETTRKSIEDYANKYNLYVNSKKTSIAVGFEYQNVCDRARNRVGAGIFISFSNSNKDATVEVASYPNEAGTLVEYRNGEIKLQGGKAHFKNGKIVYDIEESYNSLEKAMLALLTILTK